MATKTSKVSVTSTSAASILKSTGFGNYTWTEAKTALVNTFVLDKETAIGALSLRGTGDTLKIDGYSGDFTASISGTKLTLIGTSSTGVTQTVKVTLPAATTTKATLNLVFTDGAQHVDYIKGSAATLVNGTHSTTLKAVALPVYGQTSHEAAFLTGTTFSTVADLLNAYNAFANPTFSIVAGAAAAEGANASFTVNLSAPQSVATSVAIGWAGLAGSTTSAADYGTTASIVGTVGQLANNGVLTFPAGVTTATIQIPVLTDTSTPELGEGITLTLSSVTSSTAKVNAAKASGNVTVIDVPTPPTPTAVNATLVASGNVAASTIADTFKLVAPTSSYETTISGFDYATDKILVPTGANTPSAVYGGVNIVDDGKVDLSWSNNGQLVTIQLTGLSVNTEHALAANAVSSVFGTY
jgi:hypothetical protein